MSEFFKDRSKIIEVNIEGYVSPYDIEFLDQLKQQLELNGYSRPNLVFSGFDGSFIREGEPYEDSKAMFAMNEAGWRDSIGADQFNPANYADDFDVPCIGVFDGDLLREGYMYEIDENIGGRMEIQILELGGALKNLGPDYPIIEVVVPVNYPEGSVGDALICLAVINR